MKILGLIPARGNSKGIKKKNIKKFLGKPLIEHTIIEAKKSKLITDLYVSTEDKKIKDISIKLSCSVIERPLNLARDNTLIINVILDVLKKLEKKKKYFDYFVLLQPTSLRKVKDIDRALQMLIRSSAHSLISVYKVDDKHPARMYKIKNNKLVSLNKKYESYNRQKLPDIYHRNGAIYAIKYDKLKKFKTFFLKNSIPYIMPINESFAIDNELDFYIAEQIYKKK